MAIFNSSNGKLIQLTRTVLSNIVATIHVKIKSKFNLRFFTIATFPVINSHLWLVVIILDNVDKHFYYHRNFYRTAVNSLIML